MKKINSLILVAVLSLMVSCGPNQGTEIMSPSSGPGDKKNPSPELVEPDEDDGEFELELPCDPEFDEECDSQN